MATKQLTLQGILSFILPFLPLCLHGGPGKILIVNALFLGGGSPQGNGIGCLG